VKREGPHLPPRDRMPPALVPASAKEGPSSYSREAGRLATGLVVVST